MGVAAFHEPKSGVWAGGRGEVEAREREGSIFSNPEGIFVDKCSWIGIISKLNLLMQC